MTEEQERAYDMIDRQLRNSLHSDEDYAEYSAALEVVLSAALSQPASEPVAWRCRSWGADEWAYFDHDDKPETVAPEQLKPLYASQPASDEAASIMELAHVFMVRPQGESNYDQVEARLKAFVNRVDASPAPEAMSEPSEEQAAGWAKQARWLYAKWTDEQGIHSNRFPAWHELSLREHSKWIDKARALIHGDRASPAAPNEGLIHLNRNGAEAWKDVPRTGDWVADLK